MTGLGDLNRCASAHGHPSRRTPASAHRPCDPRPFPRASRKVVAFFLSPSAAANGKVYEPGTIAVLTSRPSMMTDHPEETAGGASETEDVAESRLIPQVRMML